MSSDAEKKEPEVVAETKEKEDTPMGPPKQAPKPPRVSIEKQQEAVLRSKYPGLRGPGSNPLLQKRLSKGQQKYFDSGDYNMAKANSKKPLPPGQKLLLGGSTGHAHPTPESVPARKTSLIQGKLS